MESSQHSGAEMVPTARTTMSRGRKRAVADRAALMEFLDHAFIAHLGLVRAGEPLVMPVAFGIDVGGPDPSGSMYIHGSVAAGWLNHADGAMVCATVTEVEGLVAGRSGFHHSMNYRSAVIFGPARMVTDADEKLRALTSIVDHMIPQRTKELRPHTRKELAATAVLALSLQEASMKQRSGGPGDEDSDIAAGLWGGHIPVTRVLGAPVPDPDAVGEVPASVLSRAGAALRE